MPRSSCTPTTASCGATSTPTATPTARSPTATSSPPAATGCGCCTRPGHTPGGVCLHDAEAAVVFSADTLFNGGPGATGRSFSDFPTIIESIRTKLLVLPPETVVHTGHGDSTTIGAEAPHLDEWIARGH